MGNWWELVLSQYQKLSLILSPALTRSFYITTDPVLNMSQCLVYTKMSGKISVFNPLIPDRYHYQGSILVRKGGQVPKDRKSKCLDTIWKYCINSTLIGTKVQVMDCQMSIIIKGNINMTKSNHQPSAVPSALGDAFPDAIEYCY